MMKRFSKGSVPSLVKGKSKGYMPPFQIFLIDGPCAPTVDWQGVQTELEGKWLDKSLYEAVISPFISDLKTYLKNTQLYISALEVNGNNMRLKCKKGEGFRRPAKDFATEACADGEFRPVVVRIAIWDSKLAKGELASGHTFQVTVGDVTGQAKVSRKWLERPAKKAVIKGFIKLYNKNTGSKYSVLDVVGLQIGPIDGSEEAQTIDGLGGVVRALNGPATNLIKGEGGTAITLVMREGDGRKSGSGGKVGLLERSPSGRSPNVHRTKSIDIGEITFTREQMGQMMLDEGGEEGGDEGEEAEDIGPQDEAEFNIVDTPGDGINSPL